MTRPRTSTGFHSLLVAAGIMVSRLAGLVREQVFAHFLGTSGAAGAFKAALRIPNLLQNLLGEGVLSASFIPVYARLLAEGKAELAGRVAGVVGALLALVAGLLSALGALATPWLVDLVAPGFEGADRALTIDIVRILFPGCGLLVLSAWCLGILNSHRRFFLSYVAPVVWNAAMIATLLFWGGRRMPGPARGAARRRDGRGRCAPAAAPAAVRVPPRPRDPLRARDRPRAGALGAAELRGRGRRPRRGPALGLRRRHHRELPRHRGGRRARLRPDPLPAADQPGRHVGCRGRAADHVRQRRIRRRGRGGAPRAARRRPRTGRVLRRADGRRVLGPRRPPGRGAVPIRRVHRRRFPLRRLDPRRLDDRPPRRLPRPALRLDVLRLGRHRTPLWIAAARIALGAGLGALLAFPLRPFWIDALATLGLPIREAAGGAVGLGAVGLAAGAGLAAWLELMLLRRKLGQRIGHVPVAGSSPLRVWLAALAAGGAVVALRPELAGLGFHGYAGTIARAGLAAAAFGAVYLFAALALGVPQVREAQRLLRR